ncbi:hypothetical protein Gohar_019511 [Gossypium harknessii]|uniref:RNase H type-1 domain-containing protein n=1 Tax=Gossypium harknessii TaxID=34285 RepID=A0A7J9I9I3_9ROSI|nr:hypothetical protein [Gossypium harknessii]
MVKWMPPPQGWRNLVRSVVITEATAILHELQFALDLGSTNVILESDSKLEIFFLSISIRCVKRKWAAHAMAVEGLRTIEDSFWVENVPLKVLEVANSDRRFSRPP